MQFLKEIKALSLLKSRRLKEGNYSIIKLGERPNFRFYAINHEEFLGSGTSAKVYKAYFINKGNGEIDQSHPYTAKILSDRRVFSPKEAMTTACYYKIAGFQCIGDKVYLFTEFLPGQQLLTDNSKLLHPKLHLLSFEQRINLIAQLLLQYNLFHHNTPSTGDAIIHADTKGSNLLVDICIEGKKTTTIAYPIDFGITLKSHANPEKLVQHKEINSGNSLYFPIETLSGSFGIKTDVYMLVNVISVILGETSPYRHKCTGESHSESARGKFPLDSLIEFPEILPNVDLKKLTIDFLNRMQSNEYSKRPNSNEVLRFFITLNNLCLSNIKSNQGAKALDIHSAKLCLLSSGLWDHKIGKRMIDSPNNKEKNGTTDKTFEQYDFSSNESICKAIVILTHDDLLRAKVVISLAQGDDRADKLAKVILILHESGFLHDRIVTTLAQGDDRADKLAQAILILKQEKLLDQDMLSHLNKYPDSCETDNILADIRKNCLTTFKQTYRCHYKAAFFSNPFSHMKGLISSDSLENMEKVNEYARDNPNSRTAKILAN